MYTDLGVERSYLGEGRDWTDWGTRARDNRSESEEKEKHKDNRFGVRERGKHREKNWFEDGRGRQHTGLREQRRETASPP